MERAIILFCNENQGYVKELDIPLNITAAELVTALNESLNLGIDESSLKDCYLVAENPIAYLKGKRLLSEYGIRNGSKIIFRR